MLKAALPALVLGTSLLPMSFEARVRAADRVVIAQVLGVRTEVKNGNVRKMFTHTELLVGDVLKGPAAGLGRDRITVTQLGGKHGNWEAHVPGDATFTPGETALLLLRCSPTPDQCGLVSFNEGKVPLIGNDAFVFDLASSQYTRRPATDVIAQVRAAVPPAPATLTPGAQPAGVTK
ncbi:MAG: hypothetical protein JNK82_41470 [Myxococcaceae bacterium]|nr:hypothetical protein [Myxococcaceae bacterium]